MVSSGTFRRKTRTNIPEKLKENLFVYVIIYLSVMIINGTFEKGPIVTIPPNTIVF